MSIVYLVSSLVHHPSLFIIPPHRVFLFRIAISFPRAKNFPLSQLFNISIESFLYHGRTWRESGVSPQLGKLMRGQVFKKSTTHQTNYKHRGGTRGMGLQGGAQAHRVPRNQRSSFAMISIVLLSGGAKTAENPIMESACNYEASVSYVLPRASQHARDSNGVRERTRAPALIYFTWRKREGERMLRTRFFILVFLLQPSLPLRRRRCFVMPLYIQLSSTRRRPRSCIISSKFRRRSTHKCSFSFSFFYSIFRDILSWMQRISNFLLRVFFLFFSFAELECMKIFCIIFYLRILFSLVPWYVIS